MKFGNVSCLRYENHGSPADALYTMMFSGRILSLQPAGRGDYQISAVLLPCVVTELSSKSAGWTDVHALHSVAASVSISICCEEKPKTQTLNAKP